ncbi:hypothetical protein G647_02677 [Cladophialophora carrionii CBS 160.54]|uniref:Ubiquitin-protein ligase sel1 n=1 Tax=Cladophialophora carrionii CBS 160.54 TaxID=1279043 RepID=V9DGD0_9EURO|nr:uncharacterized protein G647_02677 [Cladophialophora carrionii CBS 160.54]ETI25900.1 hypothetical protein G647_02677 [Cladophialophora carrionii CBS 160.54]
MGNPTLFKRQASNDDNKDTENYVCDAFGCYEYSHTAYAVKWAIIAGIFLIFSLYFIGGYLHAQRRMKRGLPPLAYHRWLVTRRQKAAFVHQHPQYAGQFSFYRAQQAQAGPGGYGYGRGQSYGYAHGQAYQMGGMYGPPPPAYNEPEYVPPYSGPNKVDPDQRYSPPSGPPAAAATTTTTAPAAPEPARVAS